ncbi:RcnB family protein [Dyella halodurans]|uniref:RcnB family protein n=1 Tax=Dyella halodurans TaxID=1920171 RepID=A0ABV9C9E9_9GAMM|nr:RcnB family protein [Dyella halodurans]
MKRLIIFVVTATLFAGSALAVAGPQDEHGHGDDKHWDDKHADDGEHGHNPKDEGRHDNGKHKGWDKQAYRRGDRLPDRYYSREYYVTDYQRYHLRRPDPGYRWVRSDDGQFFLTVATSGIIVDIALHP